VLLETNKQKLNFESSKHLFEELKFD